MPEATFPPPKRLGIVAALPEEAAGLLTEMAADPATEIVQLGGRRFHVGTLEGRACVLTLARVGKVAAATTTAAMIHHFDVEAILFTGVAGGAARHVGIGDIVIASETLQHDLDASPIFPRFEVPLTGLSRHPTDKGMTARLTAAAQAFLGQRLPGPDAGSHDRASPRLHQGLIISGDRFVSTGIEVERLRSDLPDALAIEMEGAAVAQVCHDYGVACAIMRTISDRADDSAHVDFPAFLRDVASHYSDGVVRRFLREA